MKSGNKPSHKSPFQVGLGWNCRRTRLSATTKGDPSTGSKLANIIWRTITNSTDAFHPNDFVGRILVVAKVTKTLTLVGVFAANNPQACRFLALTGAGVTTIKCRECVSLVVVRPTVVTKAGLTACTHDNNQQTHSTYSVPTCSQKTDLLHQKLTHKRNNMWIRDRYFGRRSGSNNVPHCS